MMSLFVSECFPDGVPIGTCNQCGCINHNHPLCGACWLLLDGKIDLALDSARDAEFADGPFCKVCQRYGLDQPPFHCDWPVERFTWIAADQIRHGDVLELELREDMTYRVAEIEPSTHGILLLALEVYRRGKRVRPGQLQEWRRHVTAKVRALRPVRCSVPVCELHAREVWEDRHYCMDHWKAWEMVA